MIFVIADDATMQVLPDLDAVRRECEPWDVESGDYEFFDSAGQRLVPSFIEPVKKETHLFGLVTSVHGGQFELVPFQGHDPLDIVASISTVEELEPNPWFEDLEEVRQFVRDNHSRDSSDEQRQ